MLFIIAHQLHPNNCYCTAIAAPLIARSSPFLSAILTGEFLTEAKAFIEDGVAPNVIIRGFQRACRLAIERIKEVQVSLDGKGDA